MTIRSKPSSPEYLANFDRIFGPRRKRSPAQAFLGVGRPCPYPGCALSDEHIGAHLVGPLDEHPAAD